MSFENEENWSLIPQCILENMMMNDDDDNDNNDDNDDVIAGRQIGHNKN